MGKARSRRTMMNRKSRNKIGGLFGRCWNCSPEKKKFKELLKEDREKARGYIVEFVNMTPEKAPSLYQELNDHGKDTMRRYIVDGVSNDEILKDNIRDLSIISDNSRVRILEEATHAKNVKLQEAVQKPEPSAPSAPLELHQRDPKPSDRVTRPENDTRRIGFRLSSSGGKSRRRHRHRRTLHKLRKSRKVRKTKCRRK